MGRKPNAKGKEKRMQRKEEQLRISASKAIVDKANKLDDPLAPFSAFKKFNKNGIEAELFVKKVTDLDINTINWIFELTKKNMQPKYESCSWGWNDERKREEMTEDMAWYLIAKSNEGKFLGFSHFRFDMDYGDEVLYCYELQLEPIAQRHGLGKFMMQVLELIGFTNNMRKVILTALKHNYGAKSFFTALNYKLDETSPQDDYDMEHPYEILSKYNKRLIPEASHTGHMMQRTTHVGNCCPGHHH